MTFMGVMSRVADTFGMTDDAWKRHANPWSVWTRFAAIPLMILAIWSRVWLGWWCLVPIAAVEVWPTVFGASLIVLAQLWRIDRLVVFYEGTR